ncbi:MAG: maleylacetoacetate isomerase [Xanthomonadales bacterium]|nr:maleylacetoacetate isomerase [Xanthomonadales bacterium]
MNPDKMELYTYWRSSAAYRVRIALNLKDLAFESIPIHLLRGGGEQYGTSYRSINPQGLVPTLVHGGKVITQSMAICEYLEECFPHPPLLPTGPEARSRIRSLALQIACEIHPLNNLRVQKYLDAICGKAVDKVGWMQHWMSSGFEVVEQQLASYGNGGLTCLGGNPGLFECFLVPQVYNAERYGVEMAEYPRISGIVKYCRSLPAFARAAPEAQADAVVK